MALKEFKNLEQVARHDKRHNTQITLQSLLNGRVYFSGKGWTKVKLSEDFRTELADLASEMYGGHKATKLQVFNALNREYNIPQHWGLDRTVVTKYKKAPARLRYITGQDQTWENREIRNYLKNL